MPDATPTLVLKKGCAKPLHSGHPWVFADALSRSEGPKPSAGAEVRVADERGSFVGRGFFAPQSAIAVRLLTRADAPITESLFAARIDEAMRLRRDVLGLGAQASPALPFAETPLAEAALSALAPKERELLAALDAQIGKIETFAAQYGMNAMEETADLRRSREALVMKVPALSETAPLPRATCPVTGGQTTAYRLINSEGDGLGGLTVDVYGDYLSVQIGTAGMDTRKETFLTILEDRLHPKGILDRSDSRMRELEKLGPPSAAPLRGEAPAEPFFLSEHGVEMVCDLRPGHGQKTGLYLDQRENRRRFAGFAAGRNVLDVFCYSGGFALHAARAGARSITLVDSSADGLELARQNLVRNKIDDADLVEAGWNEGFKHLREAGRRFDLIVLDPPKFARAKEQVSQALSAYRDLNAQAARLLAPGGILFTCSCSGNVSEVEFERTVASAMRQAERRAVLLERRGAAPDHPVPPGFEQGRYLKCLVLQVV